MLEFIGSVLGVFAIIALICLIVFIAIMIAYLEKEMNKDEDPLE